MVSRSRVILTNSGATNSGADRHDVPCLAIRPKSFGRRPIEILENDRFRECPNLGVKVPVNRSPDSLKRTQHTKQSAGVVSVENLQEAPGPKLPPVDQTRAGPKSNVAILSHRALR